MRTYNRIQQTQRISLNKIKDMCRLCMNFDSAMYDIFTVSENNQDLSLSSKILKCLCIEVKDCTELPNKLCGCCLKSLNAFTDFWELCHQTDKKLHHLIESNKKSSQVEVRYQSSSLYSSHDDLYKSSEDSHSQLFSIDEEDPAISESPSHSAESPSDISTNAAVSSNEKRHKPSCDLPNSVSTENGLFESDIEAGTSSRCELEEISEISKGDNGVEVQVSMNGSSYIVEVLDQPSSKNMKTVTEKVTNNAEKIPESLVVASVLSSDYAYKSPPFKDSSDNSAVLKAQAKILADAKGFMCKFCFRYFCMKSSLLRHERTHSAERPFKCDHCPSSFKQKEVLRRHVLLHCDEKPFKCDSCDKSYTQKVALKNHFKTNHAPKKSVEIIQYKCPFCEKSFCHSSGLSRHQQSHAGKKYPCQSCDKVFTDQSCLKRHVQRAHSSGNIQTKQKEGSNDSKKIKSEIANS